MYLINIELTNVCNLFCTYCALTNGSRRKGIMDQKTFDRVLEVCEENRQFGLDLSHFGEPLLHPKVDGYVAQARKAGFFPGFCSNGLLLTADRFKALIDVGLGWIAVTFHDAAKQTVSVKSRAKQQLIEARERCPELAKIAVDNRVALFFRQFADHEQIENIDPRMAETIFKHDFAGLAADRIAPQPFGGCIFLRLEHNVVFYDGKLGRCCYDERCRDEIGDIWSLPKKKTGRISICRNCSGIPEVHPIFGARLEDLHRYLEV